MMELDLDDLDIWGGSPPDRGDIGSGQPSYFCHGCKKMYPKATAKNNKYCNDCQLPSEIMTGVGKAAVVVAGVCAPPAWKIAMGLIGAFSIEVH
jgi:hypothetical protein